MNSNRRISLRRVIVGVVVGFPLLFVLLVGLLVFTLLTGREEQATGVVSDDRFPSGATDISYDISRIGPWGWENAEYEISESDFIAYAKKNGWKLQAITETREVELGLDPGGALELTVIDDGLLYESAIAKNGSQLIAVYNRSTGRATVKDAKN